MTPADFRAPSEPDRTPLTDAELVTVESEIARLIAAHTTEDNDKLLALQERVIVTPAKTLRGCAAKLRVIFDPDNGPCAAAIEAREFAAVAQVVEVIERAITPPPDNADAALTEAEREVDRLIEEEQLSPEDDKLRSDRLTDRNQFVLTTPAVTLTGAAAKLRRVLCPLIGLPVGDGKHDIAALTQVLAVVEREAQTPPQLDPVVALVGELEETNDAARRNSEAWDAAVTEGFPDYAEIGPGKRWATANDLPEDLLKRFNAATGSDRALAIDKEDAAIVDRQNDIEDRIIATRGCSPAGALVKLRAAVGLWERRAGEPELPAWDNLDRNEKLVVSAMRDLECVTGERPAS